MGTIKVPEEVNHDRRRFFGTAAMTMVAAQLGVFGLADAQAGKAKSPGAPTVGPGTNTGDHRRL
jgi:hypothetical protein